MSGSKVFNVYSHYYDLLYQDKDYTAEVDYLDHLLQKHNVPGRNILEFGSGTGKHAQLFVAKGYTVHGVERSKEMVAQSATCKGFTCEVGDVCKVHLNRTYDAVLSLFHVVSYQISNKSVKDLFARAEEHLEKGGLFVFDVWYSPAVYNQKPGHRIKHMANESVEISRVAEPVIYSDQNRVDVNYTIDAKELNTGQHTTVKECHSMRHFSLPELGLVAEANGFEWITAEEFLTGCEPSEDTWGVCVVLRKVG